MIKKCSPITIAKSFIGKGLAETNPNAANISTSKSRRKEVKADQMVFIKFSMFRLRERVAILLNGRDTGGQRARCCA